MKTLVTGATGFVGTALVAELAARGIEPVLGTRATVGEIDGSTDWRAVLRGVDVVFHLAGRAHVKIDPNDPLYQRVNVDGTRRLADTAAAAGVRRLIYLSSIKVNGEESGETPYRYDMPPRPLDISGLTKLQAEQAIAAAGVPYTIVRTPLVYGPGVKANFLRLMSLVDRGIPLPFGRIRNRRSLMNLRNLTDVLIRAAEVERAAGQTYLVSDGEDVSTPELVRRIAAALGRPARLLPVPVSVMRLAGALTGRANAVRLLAGSLAVDIAHTRDDLGWKPPFTMAEGLAETAAWYRAM